MLREGEDRDDFGVCGLWTRGRRPQRLGPLSVRGSGVRMDWPWNKTLSSAVTWQKGVEGRVNVQACGRF